MAKQISVKRKKAYYLGMGFMVLGGILFASTFLTFFIYMGDSSNNDSNAKSGFLRAFVGIVLIIAGGFVRNIGARGLAGSGVILDPEKERQDLEPYSRMAGGMVKDALEGANINFGRSPEKVIMIKCPSCGKLNEEDSKFCRECGKQF